MAIETAASRLGYVYADAGNRDKWAFVGMLFILRNEWGTGTFARVDILLSKY